MKIEFKEFAKVYSNRVRSVYQYWSNEMQIEVGKHNIGWAPPCDFLNYLDLSVKRYYLAYCDIQDNAKTICDVGGFWGVFPLTLVDLGFDVTMTEALKYYSRSFDPLFDFISNQKVKILDIDPFDSEFSQNANYDFVTIMAVLEHYPHSLKFFLNNVSRIVKKDGRLYIEVPNIAYLLTRLKFLFGKSPLVPIHAIIESAVPFTGHHHEYTLAELEYLFKFINFDILHKHAYNYSNDYNSVEFVFKRLPYTFIFNAFPKTREVLSICGRKSC